jgi:hypothetical protein
MAIQEHPYYASFGFPILNLTSHFCVIWRSKRYVRMSDLSRSCGTTHHDWVRDRYHVTHLFAASSRCGDPDSLKHLIDDAHAMGTVSMIYSEKNSKRFVVKNVFSLKRCNSIDQSQVCRYCWTSFILMLRPMLKMAIPLPHARDFGTRPLNMWKIQAL